MNLAELRNSKGLTMLDVSKASKLDVSTIGRIEWGSSSPRVCTLVRMATALEETPENVFAAALRTMQEKETAKQGGAR